MILALLVSLCGAAFGLEIERFASYEHVLAIEVEEGRALVGTTGGSYRVGLAPGWPSEPAQETPKPPPASPTTAERGYPVTALAQVRDARYVGTFGGGLLLWGRPVAGIPPGVTALAVTPRGLLVGTDHGLFAVDGARVDRIGLRGLPDDNVNVLAAGAGGLWIGHYDGGVSNLSSGVWRHWGEADGLPPDRALDLALDGRRLWGATEKGVFWIGDGRVRVPPERLLAEPTSALFVAGGRVYAAQPGRVVVWKDGAVSLIKVPESRPQRLWVKGPVIWLAGLEGLYRIAAGRVDRFDAVTSTLPGNWITALAGFRGGLLVGTYDAGLATLGARPRLAAPGAWANVGALAVDGERVAVGGREEGLHVLDRGVWRRLDVIDGLPGNDVSAVAFDGGDLWVGTPSGLARLRF